MGKIKTLKRDRAEAVGYFRFRLAVILLGCLINIVGAYSFVIAQGTVGLSVLPTRIDFEGRKRSAEVILVNSGSSPLTYRISFKNMRMLEDGSYEDIITPRNGELFVDGMIRYSPRQVKLVPGVSQTIRLLLRKPANLANGEYRSHLLFQSIPSETAGAGIEEQDSLENEIRVRIEMVYAISIPITFRQGELSATVAIDELAFTPPENPDEPAILSFRLNRSGNRSVSGEVEVTYKSSQGGDKHVVGLLRGIKVLSPSPTRIVKLSLRPPEGIVIQSGRLHLVYWSRPEEGGEILAEADLQIP